MRLMYQEALVHPPFLAPFDDAELTDGLDASGWTGKPDEELLLRELEEFQPDVLVVNSWHIPAYMKAARKWRARRCESSSWTTSGSVRRSSGWAGSPGTSTSSALRRRLDARRRAGRLRATPWVRAARDHHRALHLRGLVLHRPADPPAGRLPLHRPARRHQGRRRARRGLPQYRGAAGPVAAQGRRDGPDGRGAQGHRGHGAARLRHARGPSRRHGRAPAACCCRAGSSRGASSSRRRPRPARP